MSTRAIAPLVGKDQSVITRDVQASKQVMQSASPEVETAPLTDEPGQVIKLTGLKRPLNRTNVRFWTFCRNRRGDRKHGRCYEGDDQA
jgi:hypothetical protein